MPKKDKKEDALESVLVKVVTNANTADERSFECLVIKDLLGCESLSKSYCPECGDTEYLGFILLPSEKNVKEEMDNLHFSVCKLLRNKKIQLFWVRTNRVGWEDSVNKSNPPLRLVKGRTENKKKRSKI